MNKPRLIVNNSKNELKEEIFFFNKKMRFLILKKISKFCLFQNCQISSVRDKGYLVVKYLSTRFGSPKNEFSIKICIDLVVHFF